MSRLLALEWDAKEARVVVGRKRGTAVVVEQAFAAPLPQREEGGTAEADVGGAIAKALADHGLSRVEALLAVGRASIELKFLSTPPVPEEELPDLVRFQAMRQFTSLGDDWPLDFVPLGPTADGGTNVLAAAISADLVEQIKKTCSAAHVSVSRLVLRPFAAAALLKEQLDDGKCRMIVDLLQDEADLTVLIGPQVIFPRTVRLPAVPEAEALARVLLAEGRRTMIAAQNQLGGRRVEEVVIFGDGEHHSTLKALLEKELSLTVRLIDPFERVECVGDAKLKKPEYPGTFAPLLGMLLDEAVARPPVIDFLHPRRRPPAPNKRKTYILAGGLAASILAALGFFIQMQLWGLDDQIRGLNSELLRQKKAAIASEQPLKDAYALDLYSAGDITWLDELSRTSTKFPPPTQARVEELTATAQPGGGANMKLVGIAETSGTIVQLERSLADKDHTVRGDGAREDRALKTMRFRFDESIAVTPKGGLPTKPKAMARSRAVKAKDGGAP
jgi:Tfp pilus assembly PilM family ATPase